MNSCPVFRQVMILEDSETTSHIKLPITPRLVLIYRSLPGPGENPVLRQRYLGSRPRTSPPTSCRIRTVARLDLPCLALPRSLLFLSSPLQLCQNVHLAVRGGLPIWCCIGPPIATKQSAVMYYLFLSDSRKEAEYCLYPPGFSYLYSWVNRCLHRSSRCAYTDSPAHSRLPDSDWFGKNLRKTLLAENKAGGINFISRQRRNFIATVSRTHSLQRLGSAPLWGVGASRPSPFIGRVQ